jgi:enoyl-CoA hydratase/carnithine racemase
MQWPTQSPEYGHVPNGRCLPAGLTVVRDSGVAVVTLNRPERRNALDYSLLQALRGTLEWLRADTEARVVVLTGAGHAFCAGVDISAEGRSDFYMPPQQNERLYQEGGQDIVWGLLSLPQTTLAAVNGPAIGWGTGLATCCDFRFVADDAFFRIPEIGFGMYYDVGCLYGLLSLVGPGQAKRLTMLGEDIDAQDAQRMGLADRVCRASEVKAEARKWARSMADRAGPASRVAKRLIHASTVGRYRHLGAMEIELATCFYGSNNDRYEGLAAREERREPVFSREG